MWSEVAKSLDTYPLMYFSIGPYQVCRRKTTLWYLRSKRIFYLIDRYRLCKSIGFYTAPKSYEEMTRVKFIKQLWPKLLTLHLEQILRQPDEYEPTNQAKLEEIWYGSDMNLDFSYCPHKLYVYIM